MHKQETSMDDYERMIAITHDDGKGAGYRDGFEAGESKAWSEIQARQEALRVAESINQKGTAAKKVLEDARQYLAFLEGKDDAAQA